MLLLNQKYVISLFIKKKKKCNIKHSCSMYLGLKFDCIYYKCLLKTLLPSLTWVEWICKTIKDNMQRCVFSAYIYGYWELFVKQYPCSQNKLEKGEGGREIDHMFCISKLSPSCQFHSDLFPVHSAWIYELEWIPSSQVPLSNSHNIYLLFIYLFIFSGWSWFILSLMQELAVSPIYNYCIYFVCKYIFYFKNSHLLYLYL